MRAARSCAKFPVVSGQCHIASSVDWVASTTQSSGDTGATAQTAGVRKHRKGVGRCELSLEDGSRRKYCKLKACATVCHATS
jgi:hypothetical protein